MRAVAIVAGLVVLAVSTPAAWAPGPRASSGRYHVRHVGKVWHFPSSFTKLRRYRLIARHDRWTIRTARSHPAWIVRHHRRELRHALAHIRRIEARARAPLLVWPWNALADCESGDGTGTPPYTVLWTYAFDFEGAFNFTNATWLEWGGGRYAAHAYDASPAEQLEVAKAVQADMGWGPWPECSRRIGLL